MKVALYYPWVYLTSGSERTILELTGRSRHEWTIFTNRYERDRTFPGLADRHIVELSTVSVKRSMREVSAAAWRVLMQRMPLDGYDALIVLCEGVGDLVVFRNARQPILCICLTPLRGAFDPHYRRRAEATRGAAAKLVLSAGLAAFRQIDRVAWRRYQRILCISEEVRQRVLAGRLSTPDKLEIAHVGPGISAGPVECVFGRFFLMAGRIMWTKNIQLGIKAFHLFRASRPEYHDFRLVIAGMVDKKSEPYLAELRALARGDSGVEFRLAPGDAELAELYRTCFGVLFTAFNEDWGIVPVEAMTFGKPVIATDNGGPRESIVSGVQGYLEPPVATAFAQRMEELVADPERAAALGRAGLERAKLFSWQHFTDQIDRAIDDAVSSAHPSTIAKQPHAQGEAG